MTVTTLNATVEQIEGRLKGGQSVQDVARHFAEPAANVYAIWRDLRDRDLVESSEKPPAHPVAGSRPLASVPTPPSSVQSDAPSVDALVSAAARSESKRTQALGVRLHDLTGVIRQRLADERATAEKAAAEKAKREAATAEVARLERQLAEAKAKLRPARRGGQSPMPRETKAAGALICGQGCGRIFTRAAWQAKHEATCGGAK